MIPVPYVRIYNTYFVVEQRGICDLWDAAVKGGRMDGMWAGPCTMTKNSMRMCPRDLAFPSSLRKQ
jgi:hypothetical protein